MKKCNVENCENKHLAKGYCEKHYAKFKKYGDPLHTKLHGMSNSSEYKIWRGMIDRCCNKKLHYFKKNCKWATKTEQARNTRINKNNTSGFRGVSFDKNRKKWMVTISIKNKTKSIGRFKTIEQAIEERKKAELKYWK